MGKLERLRTKVSLFIIVSGAVNLYVLSRLFTLFGLAKGPWFIALWIFASISYILAAEMLRIWNTNLIKGFGGVFSAWLGISFIFLWSFALLDLIIFFTGINFMSAGRFLLIGDLILISYSIYNATTFSVRTIRIESDKLDRSFKIVQLCDLHIGAAHKDDFLKKTVERVNELNPDMVVMPGDLLDGVHPYKGDEFVCLNNITSPVYFTLGNHEKFLEMTQVNNLLKDNKFIFLRNKSVNHEGLQIIGIDDFSNRADFLNELGKIEISNEQFTILLYHRPNVFDDVSKKNVDLMLSGHTHGGQLFPLNLILSIIDGPVFGIHRKNNTVLYVSNGTGWWGPPMRLGSRNEITVIELIALHPKPIDEDLTSKLSDLLEPKDNKEKKAQLKDGTHKIRVPKTAKILSLGRGSEAITQSRKEDVFLQALNQSEPGIQTTAKGKVIANKSKVKVQKTKPAKNILKRRIIQNFQTKSKKEN